MKNLKSFIGTRLKTCLVDGKCKSNSQHKIDLKFSFSSEPARAFSSNFELKFSGRRKREFIFSTWFYVEHWILLMSLSKIHWSGAVNLISIKFTLNVHSFSSGFLRFSFVSSPSSEDVGWIIRRPIKIETSDFPIDWPNRSRDWECRGEACGKLRFYRHLSTCKASSNVARMLSAENVIAIREIQKQSTKFFACRVLFRWMFCVVIDIERRLWERKVVRTFVFCRTYKFDKLR